MTKNPNQIRRKLYISGTILSVFVIVVSAVWFYFNYYFKPGDQLDFRPGKIITGQDEVNPQVKNSNENQSQLNSNNQAKTDFETSTESLVNDKKTIFSQKKVVYSSDLKIEMQEITSDLDVPWSIVFTNSDRMLVSLRSGSIVAISLNNPDQKQILKTFPEVKQESEDGLLSLAVDPNYASNKFIYAVLSTAKADGNSKNQVLRLVDQGTELTNQAVLIDDLPSAQFHAGSKIRISADNKLFVSTGDAQDAGLVQDPNSLNGKILRYNLDGSIPSDNPFGSNNPVWAIGFRNPQSFDWSEVDGQMWLNDHGPSGFDGPRGGDEINLVKQAGNYGWPDISYEQTKEGMKTPKVLYDESVAPAGSVFFKNLTEHPLYNDYLFGGLRGEGLFRIILDPANPEKVISNEKLDIGNLGRIREVVQAPNGDLYISTSNTDGRGEPRNNDDKIYKLVVNRK